MAFQKELQDIIDATLADGVITEKERAVIHRKAQALGIDLDEVDVVIDGMLQMKLDKEKNARKRVSKCPVCGEVLPPLSAVCPSCGHVADVEESSNKALEKYVASLRRAIRNAKSDGALYFDSEERAKLESLIDEGRTRYGDNQEVARMISEIEASAKKLEKSHRKKSFFYWSIGILFTLLEIFGLVKCYKSCSTSKADEDWAEVAEAIADDDVERVKKEIGEACTSAFFNHEGDLKVYIKKLRKRGDNDNADDIVLLVEGKDCTIHLSEVPPADSIPSSE